MFAKMKDIEQTVFHSDVLPSNDTGIDVESLGYYNLVYALSDGDITKEYEVQSKSWANVMQWFKKKRLDAESEYRIMTKR